MELEAKQETAGTPLEFVYLYPDQQGIRQTVAILNSLSVLDPTAVIDGNATISAVTLLEGQVSLQARLSPPDDSWITPLTVALLEQGTTTVIGSPQDVFTDNAGNFTVPVPQSGTCDIGIKCPRSLSRLIPGAELSGPSFSADFGTLIEGDANNDDFIDGFDYSTLRMYYGGTSPEAMESCDFNCDGYVDGLDYSLLRMNYGEEGEMPLWPLP